MPKERTIMPLSFGAKQFLKAKLQTEIGACLHCYSKTLNKHVSQPNYQQFYVPKKSGGYREIQAPDEELKRLQRRMLNLLNDLYLPPSGVHGFVKGKSQTEPLNILSNAKAHVGKKFVWNLDIENFFSSISSMQVVNRLMEKPFKFDETKAKYIALLLVYNKRLPTGAPTSPIVSNLVCQALDEQINHWVDNENGVNENAFINYTRYADDITFSSNAAFTLVQTEKIYYFLNQYGFNVNKGKERTQTHLQAQWVTGIKVNEKPNIDRKYLRNIRALLYQCRTKSLTRTATQYFELNQEANRVEQESFLRILQGRITHIGFVKGKNEPGYLKYLTEFEEVKSIFLLGDFTALV
jgi:RNA-directed DNA polymerase